MAKTRPPYPDEFRARIIKLHRSGRSIESLAREFEPSANTISKLAKQAQLDAGERDDGITSDERVELRRLRRENKRLKFGRECSGINSLLNSARLPGD